MGHHDVLRAESEIAAMEAERASLEDERAAIVAMLNTLRGHEVDESIGPAELPADDERRRRRPGDRVGRARVRVPLVPVMIATGPGADVTQRIASPMIGGLITLLLMPC